MSAFISVFVGQRCCTDLTAPETFESRNDQRNYSQNLITTVLSHFIYLVSGYKDFFKPSIVPGKVSHTCLRAEIHVSSSRDVPLISLAFLKCLQPLSPQSKHHCVHAEALLLPAFILNTFFPECAALETGNYHILSPPQAPSPGQPSLS